MFLARCVRSLKVAERCSCHLQCNGACFTGFGSLIVPFTPAHTVAALPFRRSRRLDMAALVVGCLSPDFEYFLRGEARGSFGHTLTGLIVLDLPLSLLVLWL